MEKTNLGLLHILEFNHWLDILAVINLAINLLY